MAKDLASVVLELFVTNHNQPMTSDQIYEAVGGGVDKEQFRKMETRAHIFGVIFINSPADNNYNNIFSKRDNIQE